MKIIKIIILLIPVLFLTSCQKEQILICENDPTILKSIKDVNHSIKIFTPSELNIFKNNRSISVELQNMSGKSIYFSEDYGINIFVKINGEWYPTQNKFSYPPGEKVLPSVDSTIPSGVLIDAFPVVDKNEITQTRIVIIGNIGDKNGNITDEKIAAYADFVLKP